MPPPVFQLGSAVHTKAEADARICLSKGKGYKKVKLPPGRYYVHESSGNEEYWHDDDHSDGYTYRLIALDRESPVPGLRL